MIVFPLGVLLHKVKCVSTGQACGEAATGCQSSANIYLHVLISSPLYVCIRSWPLT